MQGYRAYTLDKDGHIRDRVEFFCTNEEEAKERAKRLVNGLDVELWQTDHRIAIFRHGEKK